MDYNYIQHHGVKGQRWGVRRYQNKDGSLTSAGKKRRSMSQIVGDIREARKQKLARDAEENEKRLAEQRQKDLSEDKLSAKDMSDAELKSRIERLRLEQSYNQAVQQTQTVSKGEKFVNQYVGPAAKKVLWDTSVDVTAQVAKHAFVKAVNKAIGETGDDGKLRDVVFANNKKKS